MNLKKTFLPRPTLIAGFVFMLGNLLNAAPNILFIVSEDNGPELGCYGDPNAINNNITPTLDQLARDGVLFNRAFVPFSVCSPSRACFYTGTHVAQNGHEGLQTHKFAMYEAFPTFYKILQEGGYRTGLIGKLHINPGNAVNDYIDYRSITGANFGQGQRNMRNYATAANNFFTGNYTGADTAKPFVLTINYPEAHLAFYDTAPTNDTSDPDTLPKNPITWEDVQTFPWVGATSERLRTQTSKYYNCMRRLDDGIAMLLQHLDDAELTDNTLIIYIGDHGAQFSRGKTSVYEAGLRIPFIVKWPSQTVDRPGSDLAGEFNYDNHLISTTDIMPTMLQAAGLPIPAQCTGFALQPLLKNESPPWRKYIFGHTTGSSPNVTCVQLSVRNDRYKLIYNPFKEPTMPESLRNLQNRAAAKYLSGGYSPGTRQSELDDASTPQHVRDSYAIYLNPTLYELYDLQIDPDEWYNLADDPNYAEHKQELINALNEWQNDPVIADPWADLGNVEDFGLMMEAARDTNYRSDSTFVWDYLDAEWNYADWKKESFPSNIDVPTPPNPATLYATGFENSEGFTFPTTGDFVVFPAGTLTDSSDGTWTGDGINSGIWNRSDIAPEGDQVLRVGTSSGSSGVSTATVILPETVTEIGYLRFSYANYSTSTNCTVTVNMREVGTTAWTNVWQKSFIGLQVDWRDKPWPLAEIPLNIDGRYEIQFHCDGTRGMKVEELSITEKFTPLTDLSQTYEQWRAAKFEAGDATNDLISGKNADPDGDGTANFLEYLLMRDPLLADQWLDRSNKEGNQYVNFYIPGNAHATEAWNLEYSTDMIEWYPWSRKKLINQDIDGLQQWQLSIPPLLEGKAFLRLRGN